MQDNLHDEHSDLSPWIMCALAATGPSMEVLCLDVYTPPLLPVLEQLMYLNMHVYGELAHSLCKWLGALPCLETLSLGDWQASVLAEPEILEERSIGTAGTLDLRCSRSLQYLALWYLRADSIVVERHMPCVTGRNSPMLQQL